MCGSTPCSLGSEKQDFTTDLNLIYASDHEPLPSKKHGEFFRNARHTFFAVYRRVFSFVFLLNMIVVVVLIVGNKMRLNNVGLLAGLASVASANVMIALLVRLDYDANGFLKRVVGSVIPRRTQKVHEYNS
jgi:hypothetical protein